MKKALNRSIIFVVCAAVYILARLFEGDLAGHNALAVAVNLVKILALIWGIYSLAAVILELISSINNRVRTVTRMVLSILTYLAVLLSVYLGLRSLGVDVAPSLASVGVVTLILGFGAQSLIEDVVTGVFLIAENKYNIGDIIVLDDFRGKVVEIAVRTTTLEDDGGNKKIVNNSEIRNFQNRSQDDSVAVCLLNLPYDTDLRKFEAIIAKSLPEIYERNRDLFLSEPQYLGVEELGNNNIVLKFIAPTREENIFSARRRLNRELRLMCTDH